MLGTAQDGGYPQPGCLRQCCRVARLEPGLRRYPVALVIVDEDGLQLMEVTRSLESQLSLLGPGPLKPLCGIWVTHAHLGHVDGLGLLGREAMAVRGLPLHCSQAFAKLIEATPAWSKLVEWGHIVPSVWTAREPRPGGQGWSVTPLPVAHRDELCDTHAMLIEGPLRRLLFLPDLDSWDQTLAHYMVTNPRDWFARLMVDIVLLDGTFWSPDELPFRSQDEVTHPPVSETLRLLGERRKDDPRVIFIHLNHTNPLLQEGRPERQELEDLGWEIGFEGQVFEM